MQHATTSSHHIVDADDMNLGVIDSSPYMFSLPGASERGT